MARKNTQTNMLGRYVECSRDREKLATFARSCPDLPIAILFRHEPAEVVGRAREDGATWFDVATPDGIVTVKATEVRLAPEPEPDAGESFGQCQSCGMETGGETLCGPCLDTARGIVDTVRDEES
jgi:hypothetical protein